MLFGATEQEKLAWEDYHRGLVDLDFTPNVVYGNGHHPECLCGQCFPDDDQPTDLLDLAVPERDVPTAGTTAFADDVPF